MSRNADWVLQCIGIYQGGDYLDEIEDNFGVKLNWSVATTLSLITTNSPQVGNGIALQLYFNVIEKAVKKLKAKRNDFNCNVNGSQDTQLYYKGQEVSCWEDIVELSKQK